MRLTKPIEQPVSNAVTGGRYGCFDHDAGIGVIEHGSVPEEAFEPSGEAMFPIMANRTSVCGESTERFEFEGGSGTRVARQIGDATFGEIDVDQRGNARYFLSCISGAFGNRWQRPY